MVNSALVCLNLAPIQHPYYREKDIQEENKHDQTLLYDKDIWQKKGQGGMKR